MERTKEKAQEVANKMTPIFELVALLSEEDIEYLKDTAKLIEDENSRLQSIAGILVPLNKANAKEKSGELAINRIQGLLLIWGAIKGREKVVADFIKEETAGREIEKMFGL
jgi:hypothetical protein